LIAFGLAGENTLAHTHASANGASPKHSAARNKTAKEKYGLETIAGKKSFSFNVPVQGPFYLRKLPVSLPGHCPFLSTHPTL
jgi:hypothetical protein